jgi:hypothetical protein
MRMICIIVDKSETPISLQPQSPWVTVRSKEGEDGRFGFEMLHSPLLDHAKSLLLSDESILEAV